MERTRRDRSGTVWQPARERCRTRRGDAGIRRQDGACRHRSRDPRQRIRRRARTQWLGQDHVDARDPGPAATAQRDDPCAGRAGGARQSGRRLHAADAWRAWTMLRLSGWDFVASGAGGHRWGLPLLGRASAQRGRLGARRVHATRLARRPLAETSGGERQRLLLAQALLGRPRLLLLDEPLISLDPHHQHAVVELTRSLQQELGIAVLFSAHELNPLLGALDRVLYLGQRPCRARCGG